MKDTGHIRFFDTDCILIEEENCISIIPKEKDDLKKIRSHFDDQDFVLNYTGTIGHDSIAFIERLQFAIDHTIKLYPYYIINRCHMNSFVGFELTGEVVDEFFSASRYFYDRSKSGNEDSVDFIYHREVADEWSIIFEGNPVSVTLSFGDILQRGIASDLKLHSKLTVKFGRTEDIQYLYRVYALIVRFLQIVRYDTKFGKLQIDLLGEEHEKTFYNGYLRDFSLEQTVIYKGNHEVEYGCYKPYIQRFLQFAADNPNYTFYHYPTDGIRFRGSHYSAVDYMNIFSAFESECHAEEDLYESVDTSKVQTIKDTLVAQLDEYPKTGLTQDELNFLENARKRILQLGTQFGQTMKIVNAYQVLHEALDKSIENIFYLPEFRLKGPLQMKEIKKIAGFLAGQRGKVAHGGFSGAFSDVDAQKIHFLEIITYAQLLKRVGLEDEDIERIVGAVFGCNYVLFQERYH